MADSRKPKLAIVGTGIAGLATAWYLRDDYEIHFYEKNNYAGGHTNTVSVAENGRPIPIDTGFMVFNEKTYPNLSRLFAELQIETRDTSMSFGINNTITGLEYACSGFKTFFAQRRNLVNPRHWLQLKEMARYFKASKAFLKQEGQEKLTIGEFIEKHRLSRRMTSNFMLPMASAIWSTPPERILDFPAVAMLRFLQNHQMLGIGIQLQWKTVRGGSRQYRDRILNEFPNRLRLSRKVEQVQRLENEAIIIDDSNEARFFDQVVIATHADQALDVLVDPTTEEQRLLSNFGYNKNPVVLHSDSSVMPRSRNAWSSWNFRYDRGNSGANASTHYWMNSLQGVSDRTDYFVSVDYQGSIDLSQVHWTFEYEHPRFDAGAIAAQPHLTRLNESGPIYFCGSYFKNGFHEDALNSALSVVERLKEKARQEGEFKAV